MARSKVLLGGFRHAWTITLFAPALLSGTTITVTSTSAVVADDGQCTFAEAIHSANVNAKSGSLTGECPAGTPGMDTIVFALPGPGVQTLTPPNSVPSSIGINEPLLIDGFSQPGSSPNTHPTGQGLNAVLLVELNLSNSGPLVVLGAANVTIRGLILNRSNESAIVLGGAGGRVEGCYIGTNADGTAAGPGNGQGGIVLGAANNTVGGLSPDKRNLISGNALAGVTTASGAGIDDNAIQGNLIGTNASGTAALPNSSGVIVADSRQSSNHIGGTSAAARNVISGNAGAGVGLGGLTVTARTPGNFVEGNFIGTDVTGSFAIPNVDGVVVSGSDIGNVIGGTAPGAGNLISGNFGRGVTLGSDGNLVQGNLIGTDAAGTSAIPGHTSGGVFVGHNQNTIGGTTPGAGNHIAHNSSVGVAFVGVTTVVDNRISSNSIHDNAGGGIALGNPLGPDDHCDGDGGNNNGQNSPVLTQAAIAAGQVTLSGTLDSVAGVTYRIEFFSNTACRTGPFDKEQGRTYLGFADVTTDGSCAASYGPLLFPVPPGETVLTATATDPAGNTSEFSQCLTATVAPPGTKFYTLPPCRILDTRDPVGPFGGPALQPGATRTYAIPAAACGVPVSTRSISANATITNPTQAGYLTLYPGNGTPPLASSINFSVGQTRANNVVVPLATDGTGSIKVVTGSAGTVDFILDVNGYFQ